MRGSRKRQRLRVQWLTSYQAVNNTALDTNFAIPGDATFPLNQAYEPPRDRNEAEVLRQYIGQMRQELGMRLLNRVYGEASAPSKVCRDLFCWGCRKSCDMELTWRSSG